MLAASRAVVDEERTALRAGAAPRDLAELIDAALTRLRPVDTGPIPLINATGVILHTNLGRAPWPRAAIEAAERAAAGALFLEIDRATGRRGRRYRAAEDALVALTGAEDALVTNNNAAALVLAVGLAGRNGRVIVSRGELLEIGGGVRIPDIIRRAGARLVEVGTTNRTRVADFTDALAEGQVVRPARAGGPATGRPATAARGAQLVLRVHLSNVRLSGFTEAPDPAQLARAAHEFGAVVVDDLGSGALLDTATYGLAHEPGPVERLAAGADLVTFSGDKLVGGPQAGLIAGRADLIGRIRRDPLARALRPDKVTLAAVAATLELYRAGLAAAEIPAWRMIAASAESIRGRVDRLLERLDDPRVERADVESTIGGGSLPGETLPSSALAIAGPGVDALLTALRAGEPAVMGRVAGGRVLLDLRTVDPGEDDRVARAVEQVLAARRR